MKRLELLFPWAVLLVFGGWVLSKAAPPRPGPGGVDFYALGQVPVRDGGRLMPLDTLARTTLQSISGRTEVQNEEGKKVATALEWLVEVLDQPADWEAGPAAKYKVFRIEHDQLLAALELPRRPGFYRYSVEEVQRNFDKLQAEIDKVARKRDEGRPLELYDAKIEELAKKLSQFQRLNRAAPPLQPVPPESPDGDWTSLRDVDDKALQGLTDEEFEKVRERAIGRLGEELRRKYGSIENIPREEAGGIRERMRAYTNRELAAEARQRREKVSPAAAGLTRLVRTAREGRGEAFAAALAEYREKHLAHVPADVKSTAALEAWAIGHLSPFYHAAFLYVVVGVLSALGWLFWHRPFNRAALFLGLFTFAYHTAALLARMYVQGRPPVTNLYSSAVFIGWGAVGLALLLEAIYKNGIGNAVAGVAGAASMQVAHFLGGSGDTMGMLVAVLDTNFWLATHVTTVTLGYTATFVAGMIGVVYIVRVLATVIANSFAPGAERTGGELAAFAWSAAGLAVMATGLAYLAAQTAVTLDALNSDVAFALTALAGVAAFGGALLVLAARLSADAEGASASFPRAVAGEVARLALTPDASKTLTQMMYGVVCFATLLSFVGTVLGGIWADYSWGRFWGWDPKENGAVMIVIWNALVLHARWAGMVKSRGMAVLTVFGNVITAWSWFGTNQLQIGLHSYGFDNRLASGCRMFWASQLVVMALGLVPARYWQKFPAGAAAGGAPPAGPGGKK